MNILPIIQPSLVRRTIIDGGVKFIKNTLSQVSKSGLTNKIDIASGDVTDIAQALQDLDSQDTSDLMSSLFDEGLLDLLAELISNEQFGLSKEEKALFFNNLASKVNAGPLLVEISNAFTKLDASSGGIEDVEALAKAVAQYSNNQTKIDYIEAIAPQATDKNSYTEVGLFGTAKTYFGDAEAFAIAHVLTSLNNSPSAITDAFNSLNTEQLKTVMLAGIDMKQYLLNVVGPTAMLNASLASKLISVASTSNDIDLKTAVFEVGAQVLDYIKHHMNTSVVVIGKGAASETLTHALTTLVESDSLGILTALANNTDTSTTTALVTYVQHMLEMQQGYQLVEQITVLQDASGLLSETEIGLQTAQQSNDMAELIEPSMLVEATMTSVKQETISELTQEVTEELGDKNIHQVNKDIAQHIEEQLTATNAITSDPLNKLPSANQAIDFSITEASSIELNSTAVDQLASQMANELSDQVVQDIAADLASDLDTSSLNQLTAEVTKELTEQVAVELNREVVKELAEQLIETDTTIEANATTTEVSAGQALTAFLDSVYTSAQALITKDREGFAYKTFTTIIENMLQFMRNESLSENDKELRKHMSTMLEYLQVTVNKEALYSADNIHNEVGNDGALYAIDKQL